MTELARVLSLWCAPPPNSHFVFDAPKYTDFFTSDNIIVIKKITQKTKSNFERQEIFLLFFLMIVNNN